MAEEPRDGWIITGLNNGRWAVSYTGPGRMFLAGFDSRKEASDWLIKFFDSNARRAEQFAHRERRAQERERQRREQDLLAFMWEAEKNKVPQ